MMKFRLIQNDMNFLDCMVARNDRVNGVCIIGKLLHKDINRDSQKDIEKKIFMVKETVANTGYNTGNNSKLYTLLVKV